MNEDGYEFNFIIFIFLFGVCFYFGMIDEGCKYFDLMINKYKISLDLEYWICIIDMFGWVGKLEEVYYLFIYSMYLDFDIVWSVFLDVCMMYKNIKFGELVGKKLLELLLENRGYFVLLFNLYVLILRWDEVVMVR